MSSRSCWSNSDRRSWAAPAAFVAFNAGAYAIYLGVHGLEQIGRWSGSTTPFPISFLLFHLSYGLMWISYFRLVLTPPGSVPDDDIWICEGGGDDGSAKFSLRPDELELMAKIGEPGFYPMTEPLRERIRRLPFVELKLGRSQGTNTTTTQLRRCTRCFPPHYKPDRTHHCSRTKTCVLVMDHYCMFAHTTIGFRNRKFFVLFLFYALTTLLTFLALILPHVWVAVQHIAEGGRADRTDALAVLAAVVAVPLTCGLGLFFVFHIYILLQNMTTIEFREKHQSADEDVRRRSAIANVKFSAGPWRNLTQVLGTAVWAWPLPIRIGGDDLDTGLGIDRDRLLQFTTDHSTQPKP